ncbi:hypothetical protein HPY27_01520 [Brevibacillus sp. HB1.1]|uniref:hypothetical protein n=1 Tax=Brevibacillus sp. HB1.1 TaxID=2738808 RepID=UPI001575A51D|nr:hypothetical protein [Brevibacillus sp. HB1.1]NTU28839.1 hypothetical protein [Brevibacillus sp. HB1.1]
MNIANLLASHGIGSGGFQKNSFIPLESAGFVSEMITTFSSGASSLDGGLAMDNAGNIYTIDQQRTLRKHNKTGSMITSITLPSDMSVSTEIYMEYVPSLDRIICFNRTRLMVLDTLLNILYNHLFPEQPNRLGSGIFAVRGKYFYHIMSNNQGPGCRMQKFNLETLAFEFDNYNPVSLLMAVYSTLEVDSNDNFYGVGGSQLHKYDKLGNKVWSTGLGDAIPYLYCDKTDGKLYILTSRMRAGTVDLTTGVITYQNTENNAFVSQASGLRSGGSADSNGTRLIKYAVGSYFPTVFPVNKNGGMLASTNVAHLASFNQAQNLHSVVSRKGIAAAVFQSSNQIYLYRTGVKIL